MRRLRLILHPTDLGISELLSDRLREVYGLEVSVELQSIELPDKAFNSMRRQYDALRVVEGIREFRSGDELLLVLTDKDLYAPGLNYCFGIAWKGVAIVSKARLDPRFYNMKPDEGLLNERIVKEVCHEVGHLLGLGHCGNTKCVMRFSNWVGETDFKDYRPCKSCLRSLGLA